MKRRIVSVLMALVMALSLLPVQALAEDAAVGEPVTEIEQAEQTGEGEEPGDPEEEQEPGEPEEPVREFVQGEGELKASAAAMGTAGETTAPEDIYAALVAGGSLKLLNDVEYSGSMDVAFDLVIDLNGYVLKMTGIKVENGVHLTIKDSRPDAEHKFTPNDDGLWVRDEQNGTKTVKGGVIYGGTGSSIGTSVYGGGVYVAGGGTFTMTGGNIVGCTASATFQARGGGVYVAEKGTFTMSGGSIAGCTTVGGYSYGGGIYNEGTVNLSGTAEIRDCHAKDSDGEAAFGGGISDNGEAFQISGNVRITGCTASGGGTDAVSMYTGSVISGGTFDGSVQNTGTISGGTFNGRVVNSKMITDGIFNGEVVNDYGTISGGTFNGVVTNYSTITEGAISGITVTYKANGGIYATQIVPSGSTAIKPVDLAKPGYSFDGWYTSDGAQWNFTTAVTENITLTARWTLKAQEVSNEPELTAALADSANGVVRLTADITITAGLKITRDVTVDLNGHVLRFDQSAQPDSIFRVTSGSTLTLDDSAPRRPTATHPFPQAASSPAARGLSMTMARDSPTLTMAAACMWRRARPSCWRAAPSMPAASRAERIPRMAAASMPRAAPSPCPAAPSGTASSPPTTAPTAAAYTFTPGLPLPWRAASSPAAMPCPAAASRHPRVPSGSPAAASRTARQANAAAACISATMQTRYLFWTL